MNKEEIKERVDDIIESEIMKIVKKSGVLELGEQKYAVFNENSGEAIINLIENVFEETYKLCSTQQPKEEKQAVEVIAEDEIIIKMKDLTNMRSLSVDIEEILTKKKIKSEAANDMLKITNRIFHQSAARIKEEPAEVGKKWECQSCGTIHPGEEPKTCSCGRRGGFKEITGDENE